MSGLWITIIGWTATAIALSGVWLNNRRLRACFLLWLISNALSCALHVHSGTWPLACRDAAFFVFAWLGWRAWGRDKA